VDHRSSLPATVGSGLRRQLEQSTALQALLNSTPALSARRTAARTARRLAPETADRLIADIKGTEPLLARVRLATHRTSHRAATLRASAALTVAAVVGGMVSGPAAYAAGPSHLPAAAAPTSEDMSAEAAADASPTANASGRTGSPLGATLPQIYPTPQSEQASGQAVGIPQAVTLVTAPRADAGAVAAVRQLLSAAGVRRFVESDGSAAPARSTLTVYIGGLAEGAGGAADRALRGIAAASGAGAALTPAGLPSGGYVLTAGQIAVDGGTAGAIVLAGVDADGTFNAAQSLRQLVVTAPSGVTAVAGVRVRDWPATAVRGTEEGFYGTPWTAAQTGSELDFLGRTKQNFFLYAAGDDAYRSSQWRDPYPAAEQAQLESLTRQAALDHVTFGYALSLGQTVCYTSKADQNALVAKLDSLWGAGVRAFELQFTDISYTHWNCQGDLDHYGQGPSAAAKAQSDLVALVLKRFLSKHPGANPLTVLPSEYYQSGATPYRTALAKYLDPSVQVAWTGVGVQPAIITGADLETVQQAFGHPVVTQDNYPVNDSSPDRLYLGAYQGRDPLVASGSAALLFNAMQQPLASQIPLFTAADFAWNPAGYDPQSSLQAAVRDLAANSGSSGSSGSTSSGSAQAGATAGTVAALTALAGNSSSSQLGQQESAYLQPLLDAFWAHRADPASAAALRAAFTTMADAPATLAGLDGGALSSEDGTWLAQLALYGQAGRTAVDMLTAQRAGQGSLAWTRQVALRQLVQQLGQSTVTVGAGVLDPFLQQALSAWADWAGLQTGQVTATTTMGSAPGHDASMMLAETPGSFYWSSNPPLVGDTLGVDLGSVQPVGSVRISMGLSGGAAVGDDASSDSGAAGDYLQDAVLEYSTGDGTWHQVGVYHDRMNISAQLPAGAMARYVRLRATATQENAVAVSDFSVGAPSAADPTAGATASAPPALAGYPAANVVDGSLQTAYRAAAAPAAGDALTVSLGAARPLDQVVVLTDPTLRSAGSVEVHRPGKGWVRIGALGAGYTQLPADGRTAVDGIRLVWAAGDPAPVVYQVVPWYADTPVAALQLPQQSVDLEAGGTAALSATLQALGAHGVTGTLRAQTPAGAVGLTVAAPAAQVLPRGGQSSVALQFAASAATSPGTYDVPVSFTADGHTVSQTVQVRVHPATSAPDLALTATTDASGDLSADYMSSNVNDDDSNTSWISAALNNSWVQLQLAQPATIGKAVLRWGASYASQYLVQTSTDGQHWTTVSTVLDGSGGDETVYFDAPDVDYVRMQGIAPGTASGEYALTGFELYAVASTGPAAGTGPSAGAPASGVPVAPVSPEPSPTGNGAGAPGPKPSGTATPTAPASGIAGSAPFTPGVTPPPAD